MKKRLLALLFSVVILATCLCSVYAAPADDADQADNTAAPATKVASKAGEVAETIVCELDDPEATAEDIAENTYTFVVAASNDRFVLAYDEQTSYIALYDQTTGQKWYSNPPIGQAADPYTVGMAITDIRSVLKLTYTKSSLKEDKANSYSGSVIKDGVSYRVQPEGLRVDYNFTELKLTIPVQYTLTEDGMIAEILYNEMDTSKSSNTINDIEFLAYFGAAGPKDEGYFIIPDGAGAIVEFNNDKNADTLMYKKKFYGDDMALAKETDVKSSRSENITLPVYGMVKNGYSMLAEVTTGAEMATLHCKSAGHSTVGNYSIAYTTATYHVHYDIPLMGQTGDSSSNAMYNAQETVADETYTVQFHFGEGPDDDYMTVANHYRDILTERGWLTQDTITDELYVDFYGAVSKKKSFVGIVYNARETLTSFEQAQAILADLKAGGVDAINASYVNYSDEFFARDIELEMTPSGSLGGKKALDALLAYAADNGVTVALGADFVSLPTGGKGFSTFKDTANVINIEPIRVFPYSLNGNTVDKNKKPYFLLKGENYEEAVAMINEAAAAKGYNAVYFDEDAVQLYSDLSPEGLQRDRLSDLQATQYGAIREAGNTVVLSNPNAYLFAVADKMTDVPVCSSKELIFDGEIPFLQTVLRGSKNFAGESMNITDVSDESFLRHIEYGTNLKYALINAESEVLLNTEMTFLYSATYKNFADQMKARYEAFTTYADAVGNAKIAAHSREDGVATVTYDNGVKVIVNYTDEAVKVDGTSVDAMSFAVV